MCFELVIVCREYVGEKKRRMWCCDVSILLSEECFELRDYLWKVTMYSMTQLELLDSWANKHLCGASFKCTFLKPTIIQNKFEDTS